MRAQWAAVAALTAPPSIAFVVLSVASTDLVGIVLSLGYLFGAVFFGWLLATRRGYVRILVLPVVLLVLAELITFAYNHWFALAVLISSLALFGVAARFALRNSAAPQGLRHERDELIHTARKGVLIINPRSGSGKAERFHLREEAEKRGIETMTLTPGDDLRELAERAIKGGADVVGMAGGDGSQALVASVAMEHDVAHVCVPAGTRNHFALDLGLDRDDVVGALDAFTDAVERRVDLARVNDRVFVNNASLGIYARIVQSKAYRNAKFGTWKQMLPDVLGPTAATMDLQFDGPDSRPWSDPVLIMVSNNPYQLQRLSGAGTRARLDSGRLGILAMRVRSARTAGKLVTLGVLGQHQRVRDVLQWSSPAYEVRSASPIAVGLDGEALLMAPPLRFASLPAALRVRIPRAAAGLSPAAAAVRLSRENIRQLWRIATGG